MKEKDLGKIIFDNSLVTNLKDGIMSKEDKIKLDNIDTGGLSFCKNIYNEWGFIDPNNHNFTSFRKKSSGLKDVKDICSLTRRVRQNGSEFVGEKEYEESFILPWTVKVLIINFSAFYYWWEQSKISSGEIIIDTKIDGSYIVIKNDDMCSQKTNGFNSEIKNDIGDISSIHILTDSGENLRAGTNINITVKCKGNATSSYERTRYIMSAYGLIGEEKIKI